jgi:hypothetical protein
MKGAQSIDCTHSNRLGRYLQRGSFAACIGGHFALPYEQNTQQSPDLGLSSARHDSHS